MLVFTGIIEWYLIIIIITFWYLNILVIVNEMPNAPKQVTVYKFLPRDLDTYLREEPLALMTYAGLFTMFLALLCSTTASSANKQTHPG